jgi:hypothetical protein
MGLFLSDTSRVLDIELLKKGSLDFVFGPLGQKLKIGSNIRDVMYY